MKTTGADASYLNVKNDRHNKGIHDMFRKGLLNSNKHKNQWFYKTETS